MSYLTIIAKVRTANGSGYGCLSIENDLKWLPLNAGDSINPGAFPIGGVQEISISNDRGSYRWIAPKPPATLWDHLKAWWHLRKSSQQMT